MGTIKIVLRQQPILRQILHSLLVVTLLAPGSQAQIKGASEEADYFGSSVVSGDFNGDGFHDLAIGVRNEEVSSIYAAGTVNVIYGSPGVGLSATGNQIWDQDKPNVAGSIQSGDEFGRSLAYGDFNGDGIDDLAIGVPFEDVGGIFNAGAVNVLYGSPGTGLTASGDQLWTQDKANVEGLCEDDENFGWSLASGDFDGDGFDDLAIGVNGEAIGSIARAGAVNVLYGSMGAGLTATGDQLWSQDTPNVEGMPEETDEFGSSLATGDFDGDGFDDLAIGVYSEDIGLLVSAGTVNVLYGSSGVGLTATDNQIWDQDKPSVEGQCEDHDAFGWTLATGDFDADGFDDLATGAYGEDLSAGAVHVLYGSTGAGLIATGNQLWSQDAPNVEGVSGEFDSFGWSITTGNFNGDAFDDLAIGVFSDIVGSIEQAGTLNVLYGSSGVGLTATGDQLWNQGKPNVAGSPEESDWFGWSVASGDFDNDNSDDLAIGVFLDNIGSIGDAGAVNVLYGSSGAGLTASGDQIWSQNSNFVGVDEGPTDADLVRSAEPPTGTGLHDPKPNPFTNSTTLSYHVAEAGRVRLTVCDLFGQEVAVLGDGIVEAGCYAAVLDGAGLSSGIYLVRMTTGTGFGQTLRVTRTK